MISYLVGMEHDSPISISLLFAMFRDVSGYLNLFNEICVRCDTSAPLFSILETEAQGQCACKFGAILDSDTGVCECADGFVFWKDVWGDAICVEDWVASYDWYHYFY